MPLARHMASIRVTCTNPDTLQNLFSGTEISFVHFLNQTEMLIRRVICSLQTNEYHLPVLQYVFST